MAFRQPLKEKINPPGLMFASIHTKTEARIFRMEFHLAEDVDSEILNQAVKDITPRFPCFRYSFVRNPLKAHLAYAEKIPEVKKDDTVPGRARVMGGDGYPAFCFYYGKDTISLEADHILSDGTGFLTFLKAVTARYFQLQGVDIFDCKGVIPMYTEEPTEEEFRDGYEKFHKQTPAENYKRNTGKVYNVSDKPEKGVYSAEELICDSEPVRRKAKLFGLTVTEYLSALIIKAIIECEPTPINDCISIALGANMRNMLPTDTLRNFSYNPYIDFHPKGRRDYTVEEICDGIRGQLKPQLTAKNCLAFIKKTYTAANNPVVACIPAFIMYPGLRKIQKFSHAKEMTVLLSNMGSIRLPDSIADRVTGVDFIGGDPAVYAQSKFLSCATYKNRMNFCIAKCNRETKFQKTLDRLLREE